MRLLVCSAVIGGFFMAAAPLATSLTPQTEPIGPWRRAYRAECVKYEPADYCECVTAGFAQDLTAPELTLARMRLKAERAATDAGRRSGEAALERAAPGLGFADHQSLAAAYSRIDSLEHDLQQSCGQP